MGLRVHAKHPDAPFPQLIEVVRVNRKKGTADVRSTNKLTLIALLKAKRQHEVVTIPCSWLVWIPCGAAAAKTAS